MADKSLKAFYNDKDMKDNVYNYLIEFLQATAIKKVFNKEDATAVGEAKEIIDNAFENMEILFSPKVEKREQENESR